MSRRLQLDKAGAISLGMIASRFFAMFIALSLLFGPLVMDRAMATAPASNHSRMSGETEAKVGHCQPTDQDKTHKAMSQPCCAAMCATTAVVLQTSANERLFDRLLATPAPASFHRNILSEIATPPPRAV